MLTSEGSIINVVIIQWIQTDNYMAEQLKTGAEIIVDILHREGVRYTFGIPGGAAIPIFDALVGSPIKHILTRHEQGASHMADGFARATGNPGVVLVTSGPGATNTITGIMTAHMDSVPMIVLSGQQTTGNLGLDSFQEADLTGISLPVVKHSYLVKDAADLHRIVRESFHLARTGRPGPVLIDVPKDVSGAVVSVDAEEPFHLPGYRVEEEDDLEGVECAAELLRRAKRPVLLVGHGAVISGAAEEVKVLAEKLRIPVTNTLLGKGCFPETHFLSLGMLGMHGTGYANKAVAGCDLIMSIGSRWDDRIVGKTDAFCPDAVKIHVDIDPAEINKIFNVDCHIVGDAKRVVSELNRVVKAGDTGEWISQIERWKEAYPLSYEEGPGLRPQYVIDQLYRLTGGGAIVTTDVGQHQMWTAQFYKVDDRFHWITSGGAGTMGFGFPAAIGAQFALPDKLVVAVVGDGGFQMTMSEIATAVIHKLPVKVLIINNRYLGMVRQWQNLFYNNRLSGVDLEGNPDFVRLAESYGCRAFRIEEHGEAIPTLEKALAYDEGPCLIEAVVEKEDNVFPMVPAGAAISDIILGPDGGKST
jgi:acetolactate synthase-1/2/3 large subunit